MSDQRTILKVPQLSASQREQMAFEKLWLLPEFRLFLFTLFRTASMFESAYGTDGAHLSFVEGRRSLGLNILRTAQTYAPDALALILAEGYKLQKEAPHGNRRTYDRTAELGGDGPVERAGRVFLDYGDSPDSE